VETGQAETLPEGLTLGVCGKYSGGSGQHTHQLDDRGVHIKP